MSHLVKDPDAKLDLKEIIGRNTNKEDVKYALNEYYCGRIYQEVLASNQTFYTTGRLPHGIDLFIEQGFCLLLFNFLLNQTFLFIYFFSYIFKFFYVR